MPRHKLSTLSTIMPPKGEAVRPEPGEHSSKQATKPASLRSSKQASAQPDYQEGPRIAVSFRMTVALQERLREYSHQERRAKQDVLEQALHEFLLRSGF